ncbi:tyrosine-type recombinase/integrase [Coxiella burnetii]|uniref:tyrosine-type recombinase/integrase n=2 Tax=Coxiella burnetii TaxID=777 RepID=UPI000C044DEA|nr:tyrosine-type recombinase/integrase [Coxiella burnetii]PNT85870.1 integrase [Coxiella burnetii]RQM61264.1 site-specific integrase [Coxiella burnetii]RQM67586.1 site-specific integrase [Coxiella burnetii]
MHEINELMEPLMKTVPLALFDSIENITAGNDYSYLKGIYDLDDIKIATKFLKSYKGSQGTFNSYRREIERLIHWCALITNKSLKALKRDDIENFIYFCKKPPKTWIGETKPPRFIIKDGVRIPNPKWRPFIVKLSKIERRKGMDLDKNNFELSHGSLRESFAILSSFFNYLLQEEYVDVNPVALIRQKSQFIRKTQGQPKIRRLSELQWQYVIKSAKSLAEQDPDIYERTLFIMSALYSMYLRISELAATERWEPRMNHFHRDGDGSWWFITVGKGNKERQIAVSNAMLKALKRWRKHLGLTSLPSPADQSPLLPKNKGRGPIKSTNYIRNIVQYCFDRAIDQLDQDGFSEEAEALNEATVHWLRHTGISDDVKIRPHEHVRDDAGHSSSAITDRYIDIELRERHQSARKKTISDED